MIAGVKPLSTPKVKETRSKMAFFVKLND